jgi:hypothetical protein
MSSDDHKAKGFAWGMEVERVFWLRVDPWWVKWSLTKVVERVLFHVVSMSWGRVGGWLNVGMSVMSWSLIIQWFNEFSYVVALAS